MALEICSRSGSDSAWFRGDDPQRFGTVCVVADDGRKSTGKSSCISHLSGRDELKRAQGDLQVGSVGLEVIESLSNALLELGGVLPRGASGLDLVQRGAAHFCCGGEG